MRSPPTTLEALRAGEPVGGGSGILPMIQAQRDRFKQKNSQLEDDLSKQHATVSSLRQEIASLQKDNLSLYEKTRFISTQHRGGPHTTVSSSSTAYSQGPAHTAIQISSPSSEPNNSYSYSNSNSNSKHRADSLHRYKSQYEANISPFAAFRGRETTRAYRRLSFVERAVYAVMRTVLATRTSRNLFAGYCLALHFLVLVMLYRSGAAGAERHSAVQSLGDASAAAVAAAGGGGGSSGGMAGKDAAQKDWYQDDFVGS
jgi:homeobox protein cut-like